MGRPRKEVTKAPINTPAAVPVAVEASEPTPELKSRPAFMSQTTSRGCTVMTAAASELTNKVDITTGEARTEPTSPRLGKYTHIQKIYRDKT